MDKTLIVINLVQAKKTYITHNKTDEIYGTA